MKGNELSEYIIPPRGLMGLIKSWNLSFIKYITCKLYL